MFLRIKSYSQVKIFAKKLKSVFTPQIDLSVTKIKINKLRNIVREVNKKKTPDLDLIVGKVLQEVSTKAITLMTYNN